MDQHPLIARAIEHLGSQPVLAEKVGCRQQTISKLLNREIAVSAEVALLIEAATAGAVTARALRPDLPWPQTPDQSDDEHGAHGDQGSPSYSVHKASEGAL